MILHGYIAEFSSILKPGNTFEKLCEMVLSKFIILHFHLVLLLSLVQLLVRFEAWIKAKSSSLKVIQLLALNLRLVLVKIRMYFKVTILFIYPGTLRALDVHDLSHNAFFILEEKCSFLQIFFFLVLTLINLGCIFVYISKSAKFTERYLTPWQLYQTL